MEEPVMKNTAHLLAALPFLLWINSTFATPLVGVATIEEVLQPQVTGDLDSHCQPGTTRGLCPDGLELQPWHGHLYDMGYFTIG